MKTLAAGKRIAISNILFATDFSPHSNAALPYALAIAHQYGARLYGAHVLSSDDYLFVAPEVWPAHMQQEEELQEEAVARLEEQLRGVPHQALSGIGDVWDVLRRMVAEHDIDLIVVGSHGRTGTRKLLMGSIAEKIFRQASCPVLTVGPNVVNQKKSVSEFNQILLATDFGEESSAAASYAVSIAHEHQARLSLLHVLQRPLPGAASSESTSDLLFRQLQELVPRDTDLWCHPDYFVQFGLPAERILQFSSANGVDLIVMGLHPHGAVSAVTHLAHTTAQHIVAHAICPVLTVRG
ncbi:MAG: universal stress protein [Acidobacteriia bacterium]|nr:universal stress protein [Terriglobia bacterium]